MNQLESEPRGRALHTGWDPRVLVVDDEEIGRTAAAGLLQSLGLTVEVALDGREALEMSDRWPYVAIFMDCEMPEVDGYTAQARLHRRAGVNVHTPVIAVTSRPQWVSVAAGMDHHIDKPVRLDSLRADSIRLGLLATPSDRPSAAGMDAFPAVALLDPSVFGEDAGGYNGPKRRYAAAFLEQATVRLPELWRAANLEDIAGLRRLALAFKPLAETGGAARVAALCDLLSDAAAGGDIGATVELAGRLRYAVTDTGSAVAAWAHGEAPPPTSDPQPTPADASDPAALPAPTPPASARVMLADDDPLARSAIAAMLGSAPWIDVVGVTGGVAEIVELAAVEHPDVVVLDWMMPEGGGPEATRRILGREPGTVIVAVTASESLEAMSEMISAGASCLLSKGTSPEQLTQAIAREMQAAAAVRARDETRHAPPPTDAAPRSERRFYTAEPLDPHSIEQLKAELGSIGLFGELVELFHSQTPGRLGELRRASVGGDAAAVCALAHQLRGGCLNLAAERMAQLCDDLEQAARGGSLEGAPALLDQLELAFEQADAALRRELS